MKALIIEDDAETAAFIAAGLRSRGHEPMLAADGREGFEIAAHETFDVIILDRMLPGLDGLSVVGLLRAEGVSTPVLFLTNLSGVDDRVEGLGAGGDDYLVKPFAFEELVARLYALARRPTLGSSPTRLAAGDLEVDLIARAVKRRTAAAGIPLARSLAALRRSAASTGARRPRRLRDGGTLRGDASRAIGSSRRGRAARTLTGIPVPTWPA